MKVTVILSTAAATAVAASNLILYHRIFHPALPSLPYSKRATIAFSDNGHPLLLPVQDPGAHLVNFAETLEQVQDPTGALYQVALQNEQDASEPTWDFSSVKVCHLQRTEADTLVLHASGEPDATVFSLDYFVSPIPHDSSCPQPSQPINPASPSSALRAYATKINTLNTTLLVRTPSAPPVPELRAPPALTPQGDVVKPVPEKTFLQKYWMYIGAVLLVLLVSGGVEEEPKNAGGSRAGR